MRSRLEEKWEHAPRRNWHEDGQFGEACRSFLQVRLKMRSIHLTILTFNLQRRSHSKITAHDDFPLHGIMAIPQAYHYSLDHRRMKCDTISNGLLCGAVAIPQKPPHYDFSPSINAHSQMHPANEITPLRESLSMTPTPRSFVGALTFRGHPGKGMRPLR